MFWDGTRWVEEGPPASRPAPRRRLRDWIATVPIVLLIPALLSPLVPALAATPQLTLAGTPVPGSTVTVNGSGFSSRSWLQLTWDRSTAGMPTARTSSQGGFSASFAVPVTAAAGQHTIAAVAVKSNKTATASLTGSTSLATIAISVPPSPTAAPASASSPPATSTPSPTSAVVVATAGPTLTPTTAPTTAPTLTPTAAPTLTPTTAPTLTPTATPTQAPTPAPTAATTSSLTFAAECGGSTMNPALTAFNQVGDPGFDLDADLLPNLSQVSVANGLCTITAQRMTTPSGRPYGSAMFSTYGAFGQTYGTFEARIRYPKGQGVWPAFFLLPVGQKVPYPEIDILEAYPAPPGAGGGSGVGVVVQTLHTAVGVNQYTVVDMGIDMSTDFHVHKLVWSPGKLVFSIDGKVTSTITSNVPSKPMYPILDLALGAPGYRIDGTTPSAMKMDIDYLRVYAP